MAWDYSELSKAAKKAGGPEAYVNMLVEMSKAQGRKEMIPVVVAGVLGGVGITYFFSNIRKKYKIIEENIDIVKKEVVDDIKEYDNNLMSKLSDESSE